MDEDLISKQARVLSLENREGKLQREYLRQSATTIVRLQQPYAPAYAHSSRAPWSAT
jgi:hypothetical protein